MTYKPALVKNAIRTPDGTVIQSRHRHDFVTHKDKNGETYMVDGGLDYTRRYVNKEPYEDLSVSFDAPFEEVREAFEWGTRGKNGDQPMRHVKLSEMSDLHVAAVIDYLNAAIDGINKALADHEVLSDIKAEISHLKGVLYGANKKLAEHGAIPKKEKSKKERPWTIELFEKEQKFREINGISIPE